MDDPNTGCDYHYDNPAPSHSDAYLLPTVLRQFARLPFPSGGPRRVFELGCGNGATASRLTSHGYTITGVDPSTEGVAVANRSYPTLDIKQGSCYDDLAARFGRFPALLSLEVVEHVFLPRRFARCVYDLLEPGGTAVISTPYHGYWKNLALSVSGTWDRHLAPLWDYGHIKFWSVRTLTKLFEEVGLSVERIHRIGRIPALAKAMIAVVRRPPGPAAP